MTTLGEIKFNRKDVKAMNTLMCRRLVAALYQVKVDNNAEFDKQGRPRQTTRDHEQTADTNNDNHRQHDNAE